MQARLPLFFLFLLLWTGGESTDCDMGWKDLETRAIALHFGVGGKQVGQIKAVRLDPDSGEASGFSVRVGGDDKVIEKGDLYKAVLRLCKPGGSPSSSSASSTPPPPPSSSSAGAANNNNNNTGGCESHYTPKTFAASVGVTGAFLLLFVGVGVLLIFGWGVRGLKWQSKVMGGLKNVLKWCACVMAHPGSGVDLLIKRLEMFGNVLNAAAVGARTSRAVYNKMRDVAEGQYEGAAEAAAKATPEESLHSLPEAEMELLDVQLDEILGEPLEHYKIETKKLLRAGAEEVRKTTRNCIHSSRSKYQKRLREEIRKRANLPVLLVTNAHPGGVEVKMGSVGDGIQVVTN